MVLCQYRALVATVLLVLAGHALTVMGEGRDSCRVSFPESYYVSTGTTIPAMMHTPAVAQSGAIYVDGKKGLIRVDQFYQGRQHTFVADVRQHRAYVFQSGSLDYAKNTPSRCRVFAIEGSVGPLCIPSGFLLEEEPSLVRHVPVRRYTGLDRTDGPLMQIDYYVLNVTTRQGFMTVPWRIETKHRPGAELRQLTGAPVSMPNWRFFGAPMFDEVDYPLPEFEQPDNDEDTRSVMGYASESVSTTVDYYNFVTAVPDASVFVVPATCVSAEESWRSSGAADVDVTTPRDKGFPLTLQWAQRFLIGWSMSGAVSTINASDRTVDTKLWSRGV